MRTSVGLLPLALKSNHAYQCKNTRHPQRRDPHTEFPLALRKRFAKLIVPFVRRDFRGLFHAVDGRHHSGPSHRCQVQPSPSGQDHHLDTHDVVRGQRRNHCAQAFSSISLGQQLQSVNFGAHRGHRAIKQCPRSRPAQASPLANAGRKDTCLSLSRT